MNISKLIRKTLIAGLLLGGAQFAAAGIISFDPTPATGDVGDAIVVDLVWTGGAGDYIGGFDLDINLDETIVGVDFVTFDPDFGLDSIGGIFATSLAGGTLSLFGLSFDDPLTLMGNQDGLGGSFRLATIGFRGLAVGVTDLTYGYNVVSDEGGLDADPTLRNGKICVGPDGCPPVGVPEPAPFALLLLGLGLMAMRRLT